MCGGVPTSAKHIESGACAAKVYHVIFLSLMQHHLKLFLIGDGHRLRLCLYEYDQTTTRTSNGTDYF